MAKEKLFFAGSGGQGILLMGKMLSYAAMHEGKKLPFYHLTELKCGGTANCTVIISDKPISSPLIQTADALIAMNLPSMTKFENMVEPGEFLFVNSSIIKEKPTRNDIQVVSVDANGLAETLGVPKSANMVMLGAVVRTTKVVKIESIIEAMEKELTGKKAKFLEGNILALNSWNPN